jgi:hypothetical protein
MRTPLLVPGALLAFALVALAPTSSAQQVTYAGRLDAPTAERMGALTASAAADSIPSRPLVLKALEGASRGAAPAQILGAVEALAARLRLARAALGPRSSESELVSGAAALSVGVSQATLRALRMARGHSDVTVPLVVLADLLERRVPRGPAERAVRRLAGSRADDALLLSLGQRVQMDIVGGSTPDAALGRQVRHYLTTLPPPAPGQVPAITAPTAP